MTKPPYCTNLSPRTDTGLVSVEHSVSAEYRFENFGCAPALERQDPLYLGLQYLRFTWVWVAHIAVAPGGEALSVYRRGCGPLLVPQGCKELLRPSIRIDRYRPT